ncbi:MAG: twin-arginine translocase TatA/TatE family subunit [Armatimonadetes bacterium]|nr:twin-arginine translocase TatA/TatE family subunit [Armatimonadota bacterium]
MVFTSSLALLGLGTPELVVIVLIILLLFGGAKIPQLMRGLGKGVGELKAGLEEGKRDLESSMNASLPKDDSDEIRKS